MLSYTIKNVFQSVVFKVETAGIQCGCNAFVAVCWNTIDLDNVLDLGDNSFKRLGFNKYLDTSDLQNQIVPEGFDCSVTKINLHDGEATIGTRRFLLNSFQNRQSDLLFLNGTVIAII